MRMFERYEIPEVFDADRVESIIDQYRDRGEFVWGLDEIADRYGYDDCEDLSEAIENGDVFALQIDGKWFVNTFWQQKYILFGTQTWTDTFPEPL